MNVQFGKELDGPAMAPFIYVCPTNMCQVKDIGHVLLSSVSCYKKNHQICLLIFLLSVGQIDSMSSSNSFFCICIQQTPPDNHTQIGPRCLLYRPRMLNRQCFHSGNVAINSLSERIGRNLKEKQCHSMGYVLWQEYIRGVSCSILPRASAL